MRALVLLLAAFPVACAVAMNADDESAALLQETKLTMHSIAAAARSDTEELDHAQGRHSRVNMKSIAIEAEAETDVGNLVDEELDLAQVNQSQQSDSGSDLVIEGGGEVGSSCNSNSECSDGWCEGGTAAWAGTCGKHDNGHQCSEDLACKSNWCNGGSVYSWGKCEGKQGSGEGCTHDAQCHSGNCMNTAASYCDSTCGLSEVGHPCDEDSDCKDDWAYCLGGQTGYSCGKCVAKLGNGESCTRSSDCKKNNCMTLCGSCPGQSEARCWEDPGFPQNTPCTQDQDCGPTLWCKGGAALTKGTCQACPTKCGTQGCRACNNDESKMTCGRASASEVAACAADKASEVVNDFLECMEEEKESQSESKSMEIKETLADCASHVSQVAKTCLSGGSCAVSLGWPKCSVLDMRDLLGFSASAEVNSADLNSADFSASAEVNSVGYSASAEVNSADIRDLLGDSASAEVNSAELLQVNSSLEMTAAFLQLSRERRMKAVMRGLKEVDVQQFPVIATFDLAEFHGSSRSVALIDEAASSSWSVPGLSTAKSQITNHGAATRGTGAAGVRRRNAKLDALTKKLDGLKTNLTKDMECGDPEYQIEAAVTGSLGIKGGFQVTVDPKEGKMNAAAKFEMHTTAAASVSASASADCTRERALAPEQVLFSKVFWISYFPVKVEFAVEPREWFHAGVSGTVKAQTEIEKTATLELAFEFDITKPQDLSWTPSWDETPLTVTPVFEGEVKMEYEHRIGPQFTLTVMEIPVIFDAGVKLRTDVELALNGTTETGCMDGSFKAAASMDLNPRIEFPGINASALAHKTCYGAIDAIFDDTAVETANQIAKCATGMDAKKELSKTCDKIENEVKDMTSWAEIPEVSTDEPWAEIEIASLELDGGGGLCTGTEEDTPKPTPKLTPKLKRRGVSNKGGDIWIEKDLGIEGCYKKVMAHAKCAKDYFTYVTRGDKNCGCNTVSGLEFRDGEGDGDIYEIPVPGTLTIKQTGVSNKGGDKWLEKNLGIEGCYKKVMDDSECAKDYFTYVTRGDKNCGCNKASGLSVRGDGNGDVYEIPSDKTVVFPLRAGISVSGGDKWLEKDLDLEGCYKKVMADSECAKDYFTYVTRGDKNCGCNKASGLSVHIATVADIYEIR